MITETGSRQGATGDYRPLWPPERAVKSEEGNSPSHGAAMTAPSQRRPTSPCGGGGPAEPGRKGFPWGLIKAGRIAVLRKQNGSFANSQAVFGELAERREDNSCAAKEKFSASFFQKRPIRVGGPARFAQYGRCQEKVLCFSLSKKAAASWRACPFCPARPLSRKSSLLLSKKAAASWWACPLNPVRSLPRKSSLLLSKKADTS